MSSTPSVGPCVTAAPRSRRWQTVCVSTGACSAIAATCSRANDAGLRAAMPARSACSASWLHTDSGSYAEALAFSRQTGQRPDVTATREAGQLKVRYRHQRRAGNRERYRRLRAPRMERRQDRKLRVHGDGSSGDMAAYPLRARVGDGQTMSRRPRSPSADLRRSRAVSGARRLRLPDRRWRAAATARSTSGKAYYNAGYYLASSRDYDLQHVVNPAYNQDRGPVWIDSLRLHLEFGKPDFVK